jgi:hypothetical protein
MTLSPRERMISNVLVIGAALLILDRVVLDSYFDKREELVEQRDKNLRDLNDARGTLAREKHLRNLISHMGPTLNSDSSTVERQFLHKVHEWEQKASLNDASFQRIGAQDKRGFTQLTFQISASGNLWGVAGLLYRLETSPMPLRLEMVQVAPHGIGGADVQVHLSVSTPCRGKTGAAEGAPVAAGDASAANASSADELARSGG